ncbi:hypothetical protein HOLleu_24473 [Holothuria leucospilota]|uniref:Short-chain collagen C4 n=1 Tax=Holothuria leucospilota TaxID=206669 RepID=A0A9Q1BWV2_HOLLE|nr:hypothetical protein HOLleu_24473 [Holothuria leucospilota]
MMLPLIYIVCLWLQFHTLSAVVDNTASDKDIPTNTVENFTLQDVILELSNLQERLRAIEEAQEILRNKIDILLNYEHITTNKKRVYSETGENVRTIPNSQNILSEDCTPGTIGCPVSVRPYSVGGSCILCPAGPRGYPGPPGPPGRDGRDGRDSVAVVTSTENTGLPHQPSRPGHHGVPSNTSGSVYVRWGHSECPSYSALIYAGSAAGAHYNAQGNGANQVCLPDDPDYDNPVAGVGTSRAFLYSIEYEIDDHPTLASRSWLDVSCAVCKAPYRFGQLMIPGKHECPSAEWTLEYSGYLMAERNHVNHRRSMYICVDQEMQAVERTHGSASTRGLLDLVEGRCTTSGGGLRCGPYIDGYELTCAVCTQ